MADMDEKERNSSGSTETMTSPRTLQEIETDVSTATSPTEHNTSETSLYEETETDLQARTERRQTQDAEAPPLSKLETTASKRNIVKFEENDSENPRNWSSIYKVWITFQLGMLALSASIGSSIISPGEDAIAEYVGVSREV